MTAELDQRGRRAAAAARDAAGRSDTEAIYQAITATDPARARRWVAPALGAAATAAIVAAVFALSTGPAVDIEPPPFLGESPTDQPEEPTTDPTSGTDQTPPPVGEDCSAAGLPLQSAPDRSWPDGVKDLRVQIASLAAACDFAGLAELAETQGTRIGAPDNFTDDVETYLRDREAEGEEVMRILVQLLEVRPYISTFESADATVYVFPELSGLNPTIPEDMARVEDAKQALVASGAYTREEVDELYTGEGWLGRRLQISDVTGEGVEWSIFVAGD